MRRAVTRLFVLAVLVFGVVSLVAPATVLAKPKPAKYVLVSETKGCLVTLNAATGKLTFKAEKGHYGTFTVVVRHGKTTRTYHFTVRHPKPGQKLPATPVVVPVSASTGTPIVIIPIPIARRTGARVVRCVSAPHPADNCRSTAAAQARGIGATQCRSRPARQRWRDLLVSR